LTPEQHNKFLAWAHLAYGGIFFLFVALFMILFGAVFFGSMRTGPEGPPIFFIGFIWLFMAVFYAAMIIPSFIAGYGLLKRKKWARTWAIISGVVAAMQFPLGTGVCVYTFWLLFSEQGKVLFDQNNYALPPGRQAWANDTWNYEAQQQREGQRDSQYHPPPSPPDWR
jgi:hypothetical protein